MVGFPFITIPHEWDDFPNSPIHRPRAPLPGQLVSPFHLRVPLASSPTTSRGPQQNTIVSTYETTLDPSSRPRYAFTHVVAPPNPNLGSQTRTTLNIFPQWIREFGVILYELWRPTFPHCLLFVFPYEDALMDPVIHSLFVHLALSMDELQPSDKPILDVVWNYFFLSDCPSNPDPTFYCHMVRGVDWNLFGSSAKQYIEHARERRLINSDLMDVMSERNRVIKDAQILLDFKCGR